MITFFGLCNVTGAALRIEPIVVNNAKFMLDYTYPQYTMYMVKNPPKHFIVKSL